MMRKHTTQKGNEAAAADFIDFTIKPKPSEDPLYKQTPIQHIQ